MNNEELVKLNLTRDSLNEKRREKTDQFWLSIFNAAIMFLSIATPLFMTASGWGRTRMWLVKSSIISMFIVVVLLLFVLRRLIRFYKNVVLEMKPLYDGIKDSVATKTREWTWYETVLAGIAMLCFIVGLVAVLTAMFV